MKKSLIFVFLLLTALVMTAACGTETPGENSEVTTAETSTSAASSATTSSSTSTAKRTTKTTTSTTVTTSTTSTAPAATAETTTTVRTEPPAPEPAPAPEPEYTEEPVEEAPYEEPAPQENTGGRYADTYQLQVAYYVNEERSAYGTEPLLYSDKLGEMAQLRANEIVELFSHQRPDGRSCFSVFTDNGIRYWAIAENIAAGQESPSSVVDAWMNSEMHRKNILSSDYKYIGVGNVSQGGMQYWVQIFADADGIDGFEIAGI